MFSKTYSLQRRKEMFYLTMHSTHFIVIMRTTAVMRKETHCPHYVGYFFSVSNKGSIIYSIPQT